MVRLAQYVPHALAGDAAGKQIVGSSPHTDWGFLTLVHQPSSTPGLELFLDGAWHAVPAAPDEVFVQAGDYLSLLSKERWHSPLHRVLHPPGSERRSAVYFSYPRFGCPVPDTSAGEGRISLTKAQGERGGGAARSGTFGEWMVAKWAEVQRG
ncbi:hypothetical protein DFJ74DRAFT_647818 [Hyaloraphidium curvatum]|nr:hypothetical protein DFJ74DRAFT_647818 [Hyaloraphidium curvatum]